MEKKYDTKEGIVQAITSLEKLAELLCIRHEGYLWRDEELGEFFVLGRYRLDKRGGMEMLTKKIPKEIFPDIPDVITTEEFIAYIENNPGRGITKDDWKYDAFGYESMEIEPGLKCSSCGLTWDINNIHEALIHRACEWVPLDDFVGKTLDEAIQDLNEKQDGIYSFGPSDYSDGEAIVEPGQLLWTYVVRLTHKACENDY